MITKRPRLILLLTVAILPTHVVLLGSSFPSSGTLVAATPSGNGFSGRTQEPEPGLKLENLRFVGMMPENQNASPVSVLGEERAKLLLAFREPATLDQLLGRGQPFRSGLLLELLEWHLLEQEGMRFRATIPLLVSEDAEAFRQRVREITPVLASSVAPAFENLLRVLSETGSEGAFPVIATWILRERVWLHLVEDRTIALQDAIEGQRSDFPERGWWGTFWYIDPPNDPILELRTVRQRDRTLQLAWRLNDPPEELGGLAGLGKAAQFLAFVNERSGRVRESRLFPDLVRLGWLDADGTLRVSVHEWTPDRPGTVAAAAEAAATTVAAAVTVLRQLARELGDELGLPQAIAAYLELAPELMRSLDHMGLSLVLSSQSDASENVGMGGVRDGAAARPERARLSAVIWRGLPEEGPAVRLPW